ncbi:hypothetical protein BGX27_010852 [Mortierella sp. AM989]|nr:hypothetical protein BGX27_010852 [Mortierella sp. AM989]
MVNAYLLVRWMEKPDNYNKIFVHAKGNKGVTSEMGYGLLTTYFKSKLKNNPKLRGGLDWEKLTVADIKRHWKNLFDKHGKGKAKAKPTGGGDFKALTTMSARRQMELQERMAALTEGNVRYNPPLTSNLGLPSTSNAMHPVPHPALAPHLEASVIEEAAEDIESSSEGSASVDPSSEDSEDSASENCVDEEEDWANSNLDDCVEVESDEDDDSNVVLPSCESEASTSKKLEIPNNKKVQQASSAQGPSIEARAIRTRQFKQQENPNNKRPRQASPAQGLVKKQEPSEPDSLTPQRHPNNTPLTRSKVTVARRKNAKLTKNATKAKTAVIATSSPIDTVDQAPNLTKENLLSLEEQTQLQEQSHDFNYPSGHQGHHSYGSESMNSENQVATIENMLTCNGEASSKVTQLIELRKDYVSAVTISPSPPSPPSGKRKRGGESISSGTTTSHNSDSEKKTKRACRCSESINLDEMMVARGLVKELRKFVAFQNERLRLETVREIAHTQLYRVLKQKISEEPITNSQVTSHPPLPHPPLPHPPLPEPLRRSSRIAKYGK